MPDLCLANARLVLPTGVLHGRIESAGGTISAISSGGDVPPGAIDCACDLVLPGLVELHTDNLERHMQPRPSVHWPHSEAILAHDAELAGAGITTVFDALRVGSIPQRAKGNYGRYARGVASEIAALRAAGVLRISHILHLRAELCSETLEEELAGFGPEDGVGIVSLMDHTPGQRQFSDMGHLKTYLAGKYGFTDAEIAHHVADRQAIWARNGARHERVAVAFARRVGAVLASHDDTTTDHVAASAGQGVRFAEFPTSLAAAQACHAAGIAVMMGAPNLIRGGSHTGNIAAEDLAREGCLDIVSSDYVPAALLSAGLRLARLWDDLPRGIATVTATPAQATGLTDRGRLAAGLRADLIRVAMHGQAPILRGTWVAGARVA